MDPDVIQLADALDDLAEWLAVHSQGRWATWVASDATRVRRGDGYGVTHFLGAFGGMGSLNDLYFHPANGNAETEAEAVALNRRFQELSSRAWSLADDLRHAAEE